MTRSTDRTASVSSARGLVRVGLILVGLMFVGSGLPVAVLRAQDDRGKDAETSDGVTSDGVTSEGVTSEGVTSDGGTGSRAETVGRRLAGKQENIKKIVEEVANRMTQLANSIADTEPEDAKRLRDAEQMIQTAQLPKTLATIESFLKDRAFFEALTRQEDALKHLDAIIALLEARQFETEDFSEARQRIEKKRQAIQQLAGKQENLLKKTQSARDQASEAKSLSQLKEQLDNLLNQQLRMNRGESADSIDPESSQKDQDLLEKGRELADRLAREQQRVNEELTKLPERDLGIREGREVLQQLDSLIDQAQELLQTTDELEAQKQSLDSSESRPQQGSEEKTDGQQDSGQQDSGQQDSGQKDSGQKDSGQKDSGQKGEKKPTPSKKGSSSLEKGRQQQAFASRKDEAADKGRKLAEDLNRVAQEMKKFPLQSAEDKVAEARKDASRVSPAISSDQLSEARKLETQVLENLKKARDGVAREVREAEQKNQKNAAGVHQAQARLEKEASSGADQMSQDAQKATAQSGRSSLQKGAEEMKKAASAMRKATEAISEGRRDEALQAGEKAEQALAKAKQSLEDGKRQTASRSAAEKRSDLQKKLRKQTDKAADESKRLERKLRKKKGEGDKVARAAESLRGASRAMGEAQKAQEQGSSAEAQKKREEALERLERARKEVEEEEKEKLARLKRQSLKRESKEQKQLAGQTRQLSQQSKSESGGSSEKQQAEQLDRASENMDEASKGLEEEDLAAAERNQEAALEKLRQSEDELRREEDRLEELRREQQLISMMKELNDMRERQDKVNVKTGEVHAGRKDRESRRQKAKVKGRLRASVEEQGLLAEKARELIGKLHEEGSRVFSFMLTNIGSDMDQVKELLMELETGAYTQFLEKEVVGDIDRLVAALRAQQDLMKKQPPSPSLPGPPKPQGRKSLVSVTAELLMLKELQVHVNRKTDRLEDIRKAQEGEVQEVWKRALERLAQKQGSVSHLTEQILEDFKEMAEGAEGDEEGGETEGGDTGAEEDPPEVEQETEPVPKQGEEKREP